jgi:CRP-like cAMP-binding protein
VRRARDANSYPPRGGPSITAPALWGPITAEPEHVLTDEQRAQIATIASVVRFKKGEGIYAEGDRAEAVFNIITGVVKSYRSLAGGRRHIVGFLFADDLIGLAEEGCYVNSAEAVTAVTAYRMPVTALERELRGDHGLEFPVICKLCHELRMTQHHAFLASRHRGPVKVGLFIQMLEGLSPARGEDPAEVYLPMSRSDIGDYLGISLEAVGRAFRALASRDVIAFRDRRRVQIIDRVRLNDIASESEIA